ncbi:hypothetical protein DJ010_02975 [Nocardioides silvaticus]|uniref:Uncharacterized protein n=1 Tax=Nocardioides silvaticus TaxID=2201891 RepID=A0A316TNJ1_9ACTN|nr:hypothetical protein [Nocardioides silvaticus]PWN04605.1 hypothetical protein DJ010_02975 [Nocardioides silvaticus]
MPKAQSAPGLSSAIGRLWWVILLAAIIGGAVSYAVADRSTTERIYGVVNIRPVATLANDRVDLVEDLDAALTLPSVLSGPAEDAGLEVDELRRDLTVAPVGETSFVRVSVAVRDGDEAAAEDVLRAVVASAAEFMSGDDPTAISDDTLAQQLKFVDQRIAALDVAVAEATFGTPRHTELVAERKAVREERVAVQQQAALAEDERESRRVVLPLTMQGEDLTTGGSDTQLRRAAAGAAVGGLVAAVLIMGFSLGGRRRTP